MDIFDLSAKLSLDSKGYEEGVSNAEKSATGLGSKLKTGLANAAKIGAAALTAVSTAAVAMTTAIVKGTSEVAAYGDQIDKASQKMGISAEAYQEWDAILQHSGTSIDAVGRGMMTLSKAAASNSDAFQKLGISEEEVANLSQEDLFGKVVTGLQNMEEGADRTALASTLLGGSAKELGALLNTSAEDTEAMRQRVHELGGVMSDDAVKAAAAYQDSLQDMKTALDGAKRGIISEFMPSVTTLMDGLTEIFSGDSESGIGKISEGLGSFVDKISESMPRIMEAGSKILLSLASAITSNLPTLITAATQTILMLAQGLLSQLPTIIKVGLDLLLALAQSLVDNLPTMIPMIISVVTQIVETLTEPSTLAALIDASIAIIMALADGLIDALPDLIERAPEIIGNLVDAIIENAPKLLKAAGQLILKLGEGIVQNFPKMVEKGKEIITKIGDGLLKAILGVTKWAKEIIDNFSAGFSWDKVKEIGKNIIEGIWKGISGAADWLWGKVKGWANGLLDGVKGIFGIHSPSREFARIGKFMIEGLGKGFDDNYADVAKDINDRMADLTENAQALATDLSVGTPDTLFGGGEVVTETEMPSLSNALDGIYDILKQILANMDFDIVLNDGVIAGRVDKLLGQSAMRKARGGAW